MRIDGEVTYYAIQHVHPHSIQDEKMDKWDGSGDLSQFKKSKELYNMATIMGPCGDLWQKYGINGSIDKSAVVSICAQMAIEYPDYKWRVIERKVSQFSTPICEFFNVG